MITIDISHLPKDKLERTKILLKNSISLNVDYKFTIDAVKKENKKLQTAYNALAQLFVLCDSSNIKKITLDTSLYNKAMTIIEEHDNARN